jgi:hypothetical protein
MSTLSLSQKKSKIILRLVSVILVIFVTAEMYHLFYPGLQKNPLFYYSLMMAAGFLVSAVGIWRQSRWAVYLFFATVIALIPGFLYVHSWDRRVLIISIIVLIGAVLNWKNLH